MSLDEIQELIDKAGGPRLDNQAPSSIALSLRAIAQLMLSQARGNERGASLAAAIEPLRKSAENVGNHMDITPTAALDGALISWPPIRSWDRGEDRVASKEELPDTILENAYGYFEHFCAAGWMLDLRFKTQKNRDGDGHKHQPTVGKMCCRLCGIDWRRVKP